MYTTPQHNLKPLSIDGDVGVCVEPRFVSKPVRLLDGLSDAAIGTEAVEVRLPQTGLVSRSISYLSPRRTSEHCWSTSP